MRQLITLILSIQLLTLSSQSFIPGFKIKITGEDLSYHAPQPDAPLSLLVRSEDSARYIEWQSAPVPEIGTPKFENRNSESSIWNLEPGIWNFLMLAGIDVNPEDPHSWKVYVNDQHLFTISSPPDTLNKILTWPGPDGSSLVFNTKEVDKYGDFMGYLYCHLPASLIEPGQPVRFRVVGESSGSRTWFMVFQYETADKVSLAAEQAVMHGEKHNSQVLRAEILRYAGPVEATITIAGEKRKKTLGFGYNSIYLPVPEIKTDRTFRILIKAGKEVITDQSFTVTPVHPRTIYLLHHSHNDIGYTHVQPEVEKMQWRNLEDAIRLASETKDFPGEAQFRWCTEVMWAVESWLDSANIEQKQAFKDAVRSGHIELDGLFANEQIALCGPEELDRLLEAGRRISRECNVDLTAAMITDIPGWSWALVPALYNSGVKYLSLGTNQGHRIGDIIDEWGDRPFYWVSPSGEEKVLAWIHGEGYSLFHTGLAYSSIRKRLQENLIFGYLDNLAKANYPYEEVMLRYNIGSDNGPVDETLSQSVREWNDKYVTPKVVISTVSSAFSLFESKHGNELPQVAGDLTGYWEDGNYSTARETIMNRENASRLVQAQALWAMFNPAGYPETMAREAWRYVLLYDEHTWGSWNSISEPDSPFTIQQWEIKKSFAVKAGKMSKKLFFDAMISKALGGPAADAVEVINSCGWKRDGLIQLSGNPDDEALSIADESGKEMLTQQLSNGSIAFIATDIPPLGTKIYKIDNQNPKSPNRPITQSPNRPIAQSPNRQIHTARFSLTVNPSTGAISSLTWKNPNGTSSQGTPSLGTPSPGMESPVELVDTSRFSGLNEYLYVEGRMPDNPLQARLVDFSVVESGPVETVVEIKTEAPGCKSLVSTIRIIDELNRIEITNTFDKENVLTPEAVHIAFPFRIPDGIMRYDLATGYCRPETDQLPGSNKNFLAMEHWLDITGKEFGVTVLCPDAPLFEIGNLTMDEVVYGYVDSIAPSQTFISYLMNNYWETNFAASQEGLCTSRYVIIPHANFNPANAEKEAIGVRQPLITRKGGGWQHSMPPLVQLANEALVVTALKPVNKGKNLLITLYNAGLKPQKPKWLTDFNAIYLSDPDGFEENDYDFNQSLPPGAIWHVKVTL